MGKTMKLPKLPPRRRRTSEMDGDRRERCINYYVRTHSARSLAEMLVDLEWAEGYEPVVTMPDPLLTLLATIERLDAAATSPPWRASGDRDDDLRACVRARGCAITGWGCVTQTRPNADLIAVSRNTLAPLASMLRVAVEALETYDDERTWRGHINEHDEYVTPVDADHGARARAALATIRRMAEEVERG